MSKNKKGKSLSAKWGNSIGIASSLMAVLGFLVNDSLGARANVGQDHASYLYAILLILLMIANVAVIVKSRVTPIAVLSLLSILALFIYTLASISIHITF